MFSPRREPPVSDKSLDIHSVPSALDSAMKQAPRRSGCPGWRASLSGERRRNLAVPSSGSLSPSTPRVGYSSIGFCPKSHREDSTSDGRAAIPKALEIRTNNEWGCLAMRFRGRERENVLLPVVN